MISVVLGFHLCVSRRSLQLTLALVCWCWLGFFLLVSVGELIFDLFLTSSNNLTATVESNAATEKKKSLPPDDPPTTVRPPLVFLPPCLGAFVLSNHSSHNSAFFKFSSPDAPTNEGSHSLCQTSRQLPLALLTPQPI